MKKIFKTYFILFFVILLCASCGKKTNTTSSLDGEVKLLSMAEATSESTKSASSLKKSAVTTTTTSTTTSATTTTTTTTSSDDEEEIDYQFIIMASTSRTLDVEITLDNPNDYVILNMEIECSDSEAQIYTDTGYVNVSDLSSLNWTGYTNEVAVYTFKFSSSVNLAVLTINNILFIEKDSASVTYSADLNDKGTLAIYKQNYTEAFLCDIAENLVYEDGYYTFTFVVADYVEDLCLNGEEVELTDDTYTITVYEEDLGSICFTYDITAIGYSDIKKTVTVDFNTEDGATAFCETETTGNILYGLDCLQTGESYETYLFIWFWTR